ncbi:MAG: NUDIX domain-containing protein [Firmicutes bacterium]|nr:NUDIX domain-containing protein [Bacillota bacterium]
MAFSPDELFELLNEDGTPTGILKPRREVHRDGNLHGASHVYVIRFREGRAEVLLQKRSADKDSFPGRLDTSAAGHLDPGETFDEAAVRELGEELGVTGVTPRFCFIQRQDYREEFYGEPFYDREIDHVYFVEMDREPDAFTPEPGEVECVVWCDMLDLQQELHTEDPACCINPEEFDRLVEWMKSSPDSPLNRL